MKRRNLQLDGIGGAGRSVGVGGGPALAWPDGIGIGRSNAQVNKSVSS